MALLPESEHFRGPGEPKASPRARRDLVLAWIAVAVVPVAIFVGRAASTAFLSAQGYTTSSEPEPPGLGLVAFVLLALIVLVPVAGAWWLGFRAYREGQPSGRTAALLALAVGGGVVIVGLPIFISRIIGWPAVLACGAFMVAVGVMIGNGRHRRHPPDDPPANHRP